MENDLHFMVGEIRSDVKTLLAAHEVYDKRLRAVEQRQWWTAGGLAALAVFATSIGADGLRHGLSLLGGH